VLHTLIPASSAYLYGQYEALLCGKRRMLELLELLFAQGRVISIHLDGTIVRLRLISDILMLLPVAGIQYITVTVVVPSSLWVSLDKQM